MVSFLFAEVRRGGHGAATGSESASSIEPVAVGASRLASWRARAACAGSSLEFVDADGDPAACLAICRRCPVRTECAAAVMGFPSHVGVMGGTTAAQREWLRRHPSKAEQIAKECNERGVDVDGLSDWHTAAGPVLLDVADRHLDAERTAAKHGVTLAVLHRWLDERGCTPGSAPKRPRRDAIAGPWFETIRHLLQREAVAAPGKWIDQSRLADHLQSVLPESLISDKPYYRQRGARSTWTRYAHEVIRSGLRQGWIEQQPHPTKKRRRQVRLATDAPTS